MQSTPHRATGANTSPAPGFFGPPALPRHPLHLSDAERRDRARLEAIGRLPVFDRDPVDLAFEEGFEIGLGWPDAASDAVAGILAGLRAAERQEGRRIPFNVAALDTARANPSGAIARAALRRGVEL